MAYLAVDEDGTEWIFSRKPSRWNNGISKLWTTKGLGVKTKLYNGAIKEIHGFDMNWYNEPVKIDMKFDVIYHEAIKTK